MDNIDPSRVTPTVGPYWVTGIQPDIAARLEDLRFAIQSEDISYGEIAELQSLAEYIDPTDVVLLQWAGVPEFPDSEYDDSSYEPIGSGA